MLANGPRGMRWLTRILRWRWRQPPLVRWVEAFGLFGIALIIRLLVGRFYGIMPGLSFYPAILIAAIFLGWKEAIFIMAAGIVVAWLLFVPPDQMLLPLMWGIVGTVNIGVIIGLQTLARQLAEAND